MYFCKFSEKGDNFYLPLNGENNAFIFFNDNSKKEKTEKNESVQ